MAARAIGSGSVSFGLVSIPVKVFSSNEASSKLSFNMLHDACGTKVKQQYVCPKDDEIVPRKDMAKGYEFAKGQYVKLSEDEYKALLEVGRNAIELVEFVPSDKIDPVYFDKSYYLGPDKGGDRAYRLLAQAMSKTGLVGLAKYDARGRQHLVMVRPNDAGGLVMHQLRYADEVKSFDEVPLGDAPDATDSELKLAIQIIEQIANKEFAPDKFQDEVKVRMLELIQQKIDGAEITAPEVSPETQVIDLMEALKQSLGASKATMKSGAKPARKAATSKTSASKKPAAKKKASS